MLVFNLLFCQTIIKKHKEDLAKSIPVPEKLVRSCMWQILNGLHYIHSNWIIHRDIKPSNVMVMGSDSQSFGQVKIGGLLPFLMCFMLHDHCALRRVFVCDNC